MIEIHRNKKTYAKLTPWEYRIKLKCKKKTVYWFYRPKKFIIPFLLRQKLSLVTITVLYANELKSFARQIDLGKELLIEIRSRILAVGLDTGWLEMADPARCDNLPHSCLLSIVLQNSTYGVIFSV